MKILNWFKKGTTMQWHDLTEFPEHNRVVLVYIKNDNGDSTSDVITTANFSRGKGWALGLGSGFKSLNNEYSVSHWAELVFPG